MTLSTHRYYFNLQSFLVAYAKSICILVLCCCQYAVFAQGSLTGSLSDEKKMPLSYVNVSLLKLPDTLLISGTTSGSNGTFRLASPQAGKYLLRFTSIGFAPRHSEVFEVTVNNFSKSFGTIILSPANKTLKDVTVQALRPTITQLADKMVVSIEGTALAAGNTAFDVLARAPGVFVDQEGVIQLNGRSGVTVMLNGKLTYLSARDLRTMLEAMPAENIKNIEIITNPSARFDAEGASGILNINLKKNDTPGINGSISAGYTFNGKQHSYSATSNLNYNIGKWSSFVNLDFSRRAGGRDATFTRVFYAPGKTTYFDQVATGNYSVIGPPSVRLGSDYTINDRHSVGVMLYYTKNKAVNDFFTDTWIGTTAHQPALYINADNIGYNKYKNLSANSHYIFKPDTTGTLLSVDLDYININNKGASDFYNVFDTLKGNLVSIKDNLYTYTPNGYDIYSGKLDFTKPLDRESKLEAGAKVSRVVSDNDSRFYFNNNGLVPDPQRTNHFKYRESIYAAYVNVNGKLSKNVTAQAGVRVEYTNSLGNLLTTSQVTGRNYTNVFPSVFVQQKVSANYGINYSYSRRIQRPNYGNLNPFRFYRDPYTWIEGNPYLRPQYAHSFSITQTFKKNYNLILAYQLTRDVISELPMLDVEKATTVYYTGNVDDGHNVSLTAIAPIRLAKKWESQNTALVSYNRFSMMSNSGPLVNDQVFYMFQSNHTIQLPAEFRLELNLLYRGRAASGLYLLDPMSRVDIAVKKTMLNKALELSLSANDVFKGFRYRFTTAINGNVNEFDQYMRFRTVGITARYNFSRGKKVDVKRRTNTLDELNRTGG